MHTPLEMTNLVDVQLAVGTDIEQTAGGVVRTCTEGVSVGEELDGVDIGLVAGESLYGLAGTNIPQLGERIAGTGDEDVLVGRVDADRHHITQVVGELGDLGSRLDIPQHTGHVAGGGDDAAVIEEAAAGEVARVAGELARDASGALARGKVVDGTDVIQTTASHVVSARRIGTGHHPGRSQGDRVDLVRGVGIPDDELSVLRGRDEVAAVGRPVHGVDLRKMALQRPARFHANSGEGVGLVLRDPANCRQEVSTASRGNPINGG